MTSRTRRWLIELPTRIHLWSAELEIRHRAPAGLEPAAIEARRANLAVLREYRKGRQYPRNDTGLPSTPYFVDSAGRHCAVAHLMRTSGADQAVRRIAATANLARIDDMDPVVVASWSAGSGLTKRELARIQPSYVHGAQQFFSLLLWSALVLVPFALLSFVLGRIGPERPNLRTGLIVATAVLCSGLSALGFFGGGGRPGPFELLVGIVVLAAPIVGAVLLVGAYTGDPALDKVIPPLSGVVVGALMATMATFYLLGGLVETNSFVHLRIAYELGVAVLLIGLLTLAAGVVRFRRRGRLDHTD